MKNHPKKMKLLDSDHNLFFPCHIAEGLGLRQGADCVMHVGGLRHFIISDYSSIALLLLQNTGLGNFHPP